MPRSAWRDLDGRSAPLELEEKQRIAAQSYGGQRRASATARRNGLLYEPAIPRGALVEADKATAFAPAITRGEPIWSLTIGWRAGGD
jgi:hypothetical protein